MRSNRFELVGLRSQSRVLLEVSLSDIKNFKLLDITMETVSDLFHMSEIESFPLHLRRALTTFVAKLGRDLADLSDSSMSEIIGELRGLAPNQISASFRSALSACAVGRSSSAMENMMTYLADIAEHVPMAPLECGTKQMKVEKAAPARNKFAPGRAFASGSSRVESSSYEREERRTTRAALPEIAHLNWTEKIIFSSLRQFGREGASEMVVSAVIQRRATAEGLTGVSSASVAAVLKKMAKAKRISTSSGRWFAI